MYLTGKNFFKNEVHNGTGQFLCGSMGHACGIGVARGKAWGPRALNGTGKNYNRYSCVTGKTNMYMKS